MGEQELSLGELELQVLKIIWDNQPCTVVEAAEILAKTRPYARTTVLTIMQRLHAKGFLTRRRRAGVFRYSATHSRDKVISGLIEQFVHTVLDRSTQPFVAYLADSKGLTCDQAAVLRSIVDDLEKRSGEQQQ